MLGVNKDRHDHAVANLLFRPNKGLSDPDVSAPIVATKTATLSPAASSTATCCAARQGAINLGCSMFLKPRQNKTMVGPGKIAPYTSSAIGLNRAFASINPTNGRSVFNEFPP